MIRHAISKNSFVLAMPNLWIIFGFVLLAMVPQPSMAESVASPNAIVMVTVPEGQFQRDATPSNVSFVSSFKISTTEITRKLYKSVMGIDPSRKDTSVSEDDPVTMVNWYQAIAFCNKLSIRDGRRIAYSVEGVSDWKNLEYAAIPTSANLKWNSVICDWASNGYRLPTEMEWMWAAMGAPQDGQNGGINTTGYLKLFAGDDGSNKIKDYANVQSNREIGILGPRPVAMRLPNELGIYDMSGNVWEWCWDWFGNTGGIYKNQEYVIKGHIKDYRDVSKTNYAYGPHKVIRGGAFYGEDTECALSYRMISATTNGSASYGFRIACSF